MEQRRREAAESLAKHSLFGFQIYDAVVAARVTELREMLLATCDEADQTALLSDQEMEVLLDVCSGDEILTEEEEGDEEEEEEEEENLSQQEEMLALSEVQTPPPTPVIEKKIEEEVLCGVCCAPDSPENDPIVICELCGVAVHQTCYRLVALPEGDWYCHPCKQYMEVQDVGKNLIPTHELECEACNTKAGAFAPSVDGGWVHVACSMFLPELYMQDKHASRFQGRLDDLQVVCGVEKLRARRRLRCCFCKKSNDKGACAQCAVGKCTVAYHALCALRHGIKIRASLAVDA
ncbi:hypothetical protein BBO99_00001911 [Phytophthora kernoviae]|uniref:PHD-type domain-containing protein n=2 Tax=Phytophthora kernoviae TaxID=325452 RepID=A0A3R7G4Y9_9STRA|nr:hypothetical protein G195_001188 [Phytophthora kernoviae 00238/432]KAG2529231.1 hypothetical protein JM18_001715 [Phytophthora kernoviae]KAG2529997.1 hypothetical protein JM16_001713 [Phytophthora kernoviae]RLN26976.1 hypothetical protein BBI17_001768 [Phytophthora kernoviae]RLN83671.1 hypothetical protein BBO99_00001911 [Phytophthora kernoviae]